MTRIFNLDTILVFTFKLYLLSYLDLYYFKFSRNTGFFLIFAYTKCTYFAKAHKTLPNDNGRCRRIWGEEDTKNVLERD